MKTSPYIILVVEPDDDWFARLNNTLQKRDYTVHRCKSSANVMNVCKKKYPDLIIMEQDLDEKDGVEIAMEIREDHLIRKTPIVFFSDTADIYTQIAAFEAGADGFIKKGQKGKLILARLKAILRRTYEMDEKPSVVRNFGDIDIDEDQVTVFKNGSPVKLSKKEFELLMLLTSKPGKVFRRPNILKKLWGDDIIVGDRNIDTHIKKLRKKLGKDYIHTSRGIGYKFKPPPPDKK